LSLLKIRFILTVRNNIAEEAAYYVPRYVDSTSSNNIVIDNVHVESIGVSKDECINLYMFSFSSFY